MNNAACLNTLILDCTRAPGWIALEAGVSSEERMLEGSNSEALAPSVYSLLEAVDISATDLDRIIVAVGPGSFTGIRSALAFASGISLVSGTPLVGINLFQAAGALLRRSPGLYLLHLTANRNEDFVLHLTVGPSGEVVSDWCARTIESSGLSAELGSWGAGEQTRTLCLIDSERGILANKRREAFLGAAVTPNLCGSAEPWYGKPVQAKTLKERGILPINAS